MNPQDKLKQFQSEAEIHLNELQNLINCLPSHGNIESECQRLVLINNFNELERAVSSTTAFDVMSFDELVAFIHGAIEADYDDADGISEMLEDAGLADLLNDAPECPDVEDLANLVRSELLDQSDDYSLIIRVLDAMGYDVDTLEEK
ncbi:hypothetical protein [Neptuniibacter sp. QD37_11]|uniref:hypothetical protein n=1 Tax=Neptuniibacter sp. QD37_11 TaxID=3398209 RepID=UPI0039F522F4